jgi:hypothetical protein
LLLGHARRSGVAVAIAIPVSIPVSITVPVSISIAVPISIAIAVPVSITVAIAVPITVSIAVPITVSITVSIPVPIAITVAVPVPIPFTAEVALGRHVIEDRHVTKTAAFVDGRVIVDAVPNLVIDRTLAGREHVDILDHADQAIAAVRSAAASVAGLGLARESRRERERDQGGCAQQPRQALVDQRQIGKTWHHD